MDPNFVYQHKVRLPNSYFEKWKKVPAFPGNKADGDWCKTTGWRNHDFPRVWCLLDFIEWTRDLDLSGTIGFTCDHDPELEHVIDKFQKHRHFKYPPHDLHDLQLSPGEKLDFFLFNQTLEHLHNQRLAMKNIREMMKPGGLVFTSVPTLNIPHMTPIHFGGLTPMGLAALFTNDFEILHIGQWGNYDYIVKMFKDHHWPDFYELANENGEVTNEERNCCQCWILAKTL